MLDEVPPDNYCPPPEDVARCHGLRAFRRFAVLFGLAEAKAGAGGRRSYPLEVRKTPALDEFVRFEV